MEVKQKQLIKRVDRQQNIIDRQQKEIVDLKNSIAHPHSHGVHGTVAFTAKLMPLKHIGAGQTIVFDSVLTNVGGAYNRQTGIFKAPSKGVYVFNYAAMIKGGQHEYLELVKDGRHLVWNLPHSVGAKHLVSTSKTATVELEKGNCVWVRTSKSAKHGTGYVHGNGFSTFSGWILQ